MTRFIVAREPRSGGIQKQLFGEFISNSAWSIIGKLGGFPLALPAKVVQTMELVKFFRYKSSGQRKRGA